MKPRRFARAACCALLMAHGFAAAQNSVILPFASAPQKSSLIEDESRIWDESGELDKSMRRRGELYGDAAVNGYLQSLLDELFPEFQGAIRIQVVNDHGLNAFAMPNGSLYINLGLLARLENEAQLAAVLAHEGGHFVYRHGYQHRESARGATAFAVIVGSVGGVVGALGQLAAVSSIYGFSREHEREADRIGFDRIVKLGYDSQQGVRVFELLRDESKILEYKEQFMFASHPKLDERVQNFKDMREQNAAARTAVRTEEQRFLAVTQKVRLDWINRALGASRYKTVIHVLSQPGVEKRFPAHYPYYQGEAYRMSNDEADQAKALAAYQQALQNMPAFAQTYRALGMLHMRGDSKAEAKVMFQKYLAMKPDAEDAGFIKSYIEQIQ